MNALYVEKKTVPLNYCDTLWKENVTPTEKMGPTEGVCR